MRTPVAGAGLVPIVARSFAALLVMTAALVAPTAESPAQRRALSIGIVAPFSGPLGAAGEAVRREVAPVLAGHKLAVADDSGKPDLAVAAVERLIQAERIQLLIGPVTVATTTAVADRLRTHNVPAIALASAAETQLDQIGQRNRHLVLFDSVPSKQLAAVGIYVREAGVRTISIGSVGYLANAEAVARYLNRTAERVQVLVKDVGGTDRPLEQLRALSFQTQLTIVLAPEALARDLVAARGIEKAVVPILIFSPPPIETRARLAADLARRAIERDALTPDAFLRELRTIPFFDGERRVLLLNWDVVASRIPQYLDRAINESAATDTKVCTCNEADGTCRKTTCLAYDQCRKDESVTPCKIWCGRAVEKK